MIPSSLDFSADLGPGRGPGVGAQLALSRVRGHVGFPLGQDQFCRGARHQDIFIKS